MWMKVPLGWYEHLKTKCKVIVGGNAWNGLKDGSLAWNSNNPLSYANANYGLVAESTKRYYAGIGHREMYKLNNIPRRVRKSCEAGIVSRSVGYGEIQIGHGS